MRDPRHPYRAVRSPGGTALPVLRLKRRVTALSVALIALACTFVLGYPWIAQAEGAGVVLTMGLWVGVVLTVLGLFAGAALAVDRGDRS
jgi:hypothetical protein